MATDSREGTELSLDTAAELAEREHDVAIEGRSPWYLAWRRLRRNYLALGSLVIFILVVAACLLAGVYARDVAHTDAYTNHITDVVKVGNKEVPVISAGGTYIDPKTHQLRAKGVTILGPTWWHAGGRFVLGADENGRDNAVRLLYGGRNSLQVGIVSALIFVVLAVILSLLAGFYCGWGGWGVH